MTAATDEWKGTRFGIAEPRDVEALAAIDKTSPRPWDASAFAAEVGRDPATVFVLRSAEAVAAFAVVRVHGGEMDILNLAVAEHQRRQGGGFFLLEALLDRAAETSVRAVFLEVRASNGAARKLYKKAGFHETQTRPGFYQEPAEDAVLMRKEIDSGKG